MFQLTRSHSLEQGGSRLAKTTPSVTRTLFGILVRIFRFRVCSVALLALGPFFAFAGGIVSAIAPNPILQVIPCREGNVTRFFVQNLEAAEITVTFDLALMNLKGSVRFPFTSTFPPHQRIEAFCLAPIHEDAQWHYTLTNYYTLGSNRAVHDDTCVYGLPYNAGQAFRVSQGYNEAFSHTGLERRYSIDWRMPSGTPVCAARPGMVVGTKADSEAGGPNPKYERDANYILIQHRDGTIGNYAHLLFQGVKVKVGQRVEAGEVIGLSGNTGFSSGPHLHFSVFKAKNGQERESVPIRFETDQGGAMTLLSGREYQAPKTLLAATRTRTRKAMN